MNFEETTNLTWNPNYLYSEILNEDLKSKILLNLKYWFQGHSFYIKLYGLDTHILSKWGGSIN